MKKNIIKRRNKWILLKNSQHWNRKNPYSKCQKDNHIFELSPYKINPNPTCKHNYKQSPHKQEKCIHHKINIPIINKKPPELQISNKQRLEPQWKSKTTSSFKITTQPIKHKDPPNQNIQVETIKHDDNDEQIPELIEREEQLHSDDPENEYNKTIFQKHINKDDITSSDKSNTLEYLTNYE